MEYQAIVERLEKEINIIRLPALEIQLKLYDILIPILCSIIIPVNFLMCLSSGLLLHKRQQPRSTYIFLGNIALSDLLIGAATLFLQYFPSHLQNETGCCISMALHVCPSIVSIWSIGLIAIDRYLYILYGLYYQRLISSQRARFMVSAVWVLAGAVSFLPAFGFRNPTDNGKLCWFIVLFPPKIVLLIIVFAMIPLCLIIVLYSIILKHALVKANELNRASLSQYGTQVGDLRIFRGGAVLTRTSEDPQISLINTTPTQADREIEEEKRWFIFKCIRRTQKSTSNFQVYSPTKWKAIKIVLLTTGAFFITWFPFFVAAMLYASCDPISDPEYCFSLIIAIGRPLTLLGMCNSLLNPIIYAWWHTGFREPAKIIFRRLLCRRFQTEETHMPLNRMNSVKVETCQESNQMPEELSTVGIMTTPIINGF